MTRIASEPTLGELFTPKLVTILREGYGTRDLRADAMAGLTVAIVALPLSMAIAIASGVSPDRGLHTGLIGGFLVSLLGGSRFQIGGPAGAFIVPVAATVATHGVDGLVLATLLSGIMLALVGALRLGSFIKYIPHPVTVGFTAGIAAIIFASQIKDLLGLTLAAPEPAPLIAKLEVLLPALPTVNPAAAGVALATIATILLVRSCRPGWPALLIAVTAAAVAAAVLGLPVETIGSRFGGIPRSLPTPTLPTFTVDKVVAVLPAALSFTLLGAIESLLSAVVADGMSGRRHRSNVELVAQGVANVGSALFGGFCVTGTIARTATNVRSGARGPVSGMLHALFLAGFLLLAAPIASHIPLAALAGVLAVVAWNMVERHALLVLLRASRGDAIVLLVTLTLVVFHDLAEGILIGFAVGALLFLHRMAEAVAVERARFLSEPDMADHTATPGQPHFDGAGARDPDLVIYRISGAFFFGAAARVSAILDRIGAQPKRYAIDFSGVPYLDSTAAATMGAFVAKAARARAAVVIIGADPPVRRMLELQGVAAPAVTFVDCLDQVAAGD
jgi:SulP family sulfate permease